MKRRRTARVAPLGALSVLSEDALVHCLSFCNSSELCLACEISWPLHHLLTDRSVQRLVFRAHVESLRAHTAWFLSNGKSGVPKVRCDVCHCYCQRTTPTEGNPKRRTTENRCCVWPLRRFTGRHLSPPESFQPSDDERQQLHRLAQNLDDSMVGDTFDGLLALEPSMRDLRRIYHGLCRVLGHGLARLDLDPSLVSQCPDVLVPWWKALLSRHHMTKALVLSNERSTSCVTRETTWLSFRCLLQAVRQTPSFETIAVMSTFQTVRVDAGPPLSKVRSCRPLRTAEVCRLLSGHPRLQSLSYEGKELVRHDQFEDIMRFLRDTPQLQEVRVPGLDSLLMQRQVFAYLEQLSRYRIGDVRRHRSKLRSFDWFTCFESHGNDFAGYARVLLHNVSLVFVSCELDFTEPQRAALASILRVMPCPNFEWRVFRRAFDESVRTLPKSQRASVGIGLIREAIEFRLAQKS